MKKLLWIIPTLVLLWVVGYGIYLHRMLARITSLSGVTLTVEPYQLQPYTGPTREINLGYATFKLPAKWDGELVGVPDLGAIIKRPGGQNLGFMPPASFRIGEFDELAKSYRQLTGEEIRSMHELRKKSMAAQPISVWDVPRLGRKRATAEALVLTIKAMQLGNIDRVQLYETPERAVWIESGPKMAVVGIYDRATDINHSLVLSPDDLDELLGALIPSYRLLTSDVSEKKIEMMMTSAGIAPPRSPESATDPASEENRLKELADEIRRRRARKQ